jgi:hypothetical protein
MVEGKGRNIKYWKLTPIAKISVNQRHSIKNDLPQIVDMLICFNNFI